jgi:predicted DNA binding CopG/RHH family protein
MAKTKKINYGKKDLLAKDTFNPATAKERITIWLDEETLDVFRKRALAEGTKYQSLVNQALREAARRPSLVERVENLEKKLGTG